MTWGHQSQHNNRNHDVIPFEQKQLKTWYGNLQYVYVSMSMTFCACMWIRQIISTCLDGPRVLNLIAVCKELTFSIKVFKADWKSKMPSYCNDPWAGLHNKGAKIASEAVPGNVMEYILKKENLPWIEREVMKKYHVLCQERILESEARPSFFFMKFQCINWWCYKLALPQRYVIVSSISSWLAV